MSRVKQYKTKQKKEIVNYLKWTSGTKVTANDIIKHFSDCDIPIGISTIYRHLEYMVENGIVKKCFVDGISSACFEYVGDETNNVVNRFYLKCEQCGKLVHFQCHELEHIQDHLFTDHGFSINSSKTVFYGTCNKCTNKNY